MTKNTARKDLILGLILLLLLISFLESVFQVIYPTSGILQALLVGFSALVLLMVASQIPLFTHNIHLVPLFGGISILLSALIGGLLVSSGYVVARSIFSIGIHGILVIVLYLIFVFGIHPLMGERY